MTESGRTARLLRKIPIAELVNKSVVQTLNRSINTSVTVLICIITVFIFASVNNIQSIEEFTLPLTVGIISGMYSIDIHSKLTVCCLEGTPAEKTCSCKGSKGCKGYKIVYIKME